MSSGNDDTSGFTILDELVLIENEAGRYDLAAWPNCSVPDCEYKANISGGAVSPASDMCCFHQRGEQPIPYEQYISSQ